MNTFNLLSDLVCWVEGRPFQALVSPETLHAWALCEQAGLVSSLYVLVFEKRSGVSTDFRQSIFCDASEKAAQRRLWQENGRKRSKFEYFPLSVAQQTRNEPMLFRRGR